MTGILLDTTVLIDLSRGNIDAADFVDMQINSQIPIRLDAPERLKLCVLRMQPSAKLIMPDK